MGQIWIGADKAEGLSLGATRPCIFVGSLVAAPWWRLGAWDDGEGCFHLRALGLWAEVHHSAGQQASAAAAA